MEIRVEISVDWYCSYVWSQYLVLPKKTSWSSQALSNLYKIWKFQSAMWTLCFTKKRSLLRVVHQLGHLQHIEERLQGFKVGPDLSALDLGDRWVGLGVATIAIKLWGSWTCVFFAAILSYRPIPSHKLGEVGILQCRWFPIWTASGLGNSDSANLAR